MNFIIFFTLFVTAHALELSFTESPAGAIEKDLTYDMTWNSDLLLSEITISIYQFDIEIEEIYSTNSNERYYGFSYDESGTNYSLMLYAVAADDTTDEIFTEYFTIVDEGGDDFPWWGFLLGAIIIGYIHVFYCCPSYCFPCCILYYLIRWFPGGQDRRQKRRQIPIRHVARFEPGNIEERRNSKSPEVQIELGLPPRGDSLLIDIDPPSYHSNSYVN